MTSVPTAWSKNYDHPTRWSQPFMARRLPEILFVQARRRPDARFLHFMGRDFTYGEIAEQVERMAGALRERGVGPDCQVGLFLPNCPQYVIAYYAIMHAGGTVVNFSPLYSAEELAWQVEDSGTRLMVTLDVEALYPLIDEVRGQSCLETLIVGTIPDVLPPLKAAAYRLLKRSERAEVSYDERTLRFSDMTDAGKIMAPARGKPEETTALIQYTGGTTGRPKGAILTHANLSINAAQVQSLDGDPKGNGSILGALPLFHVFANTCVLNRTVIDGGWIVLLPKFEVKAALKAIDEHDISSVPGVPTMYQAILDHPKVDDYDLSTIDICISGGAPMPKELRDAFIAKTGAKLIEGYGLTESSGVVSCNPYESGGKAGSIGQPLPSTNIVIVDQDDPQKILPQGEKGEITVDGPQILKRYHNRPEANETTFVDGRLRTGDVGYIDEDGYVFIVDRMKDLILVGGFNVYPSAIERVLYTHEAVREAVVIGIPDSRLGEKPKAFVTLKEGARASGEELRSFAEGHLGKHERLAAVEIRDELPKTMIGKLSRKELVADEKAKVAA